MSPGLLSRLLGFGAPQPSPEQLADQERSLELLEAGGLPLHAQRRLEALGAGGDGGRLYTSDLSVNEFALLEREGIQPLTQVMGSSVFKQGWQNLPGGSWAGGGLGGWQGGGGWTSELTSISNAFNGARRRALGRLQQEAELAAADAVVGVRLSHGGHAWIDYDTTEFTAVGTAVRLPAALRTGRTVITDLSAQEYWQLAQSGYRPVGVVGISTVLYVASSWADSQVLRSGSAFWSMAGYANQELRDFTRGFYEAREIAMTHLNAQAGALGAHGIVAVTADEHIRKREYEGAGNRPHVDLVISIHLLGTAITEGHEPLRARSVQAVVPLRPGTV